MINKKSYEFLEQKVLQYHSKSLSTEQNSAHFQPNDPEIPKLNLNGALDLV